MGSDGFAQSMCQMHRFSVVIIALTARVPLNQTIDYRRASPQTEYESFVAAMQNFPGAEDHNPESVTEVQLSSATPPALPPERRFLEKSDGLIRMRIDLLSSQLIMQPVICLSTRRLARPLITRSACTYEAVQCRF